MNSYAEQAAYQDSLAKLIANLEQARSDTEQLPIAVRGRALTSLSAAFVKVGCELRAWDTKLQRDVEEATDAQRLADVREWLLSLPAHTRREFYEACALEEIARNTPLRISVGTR